MSVRLPRWMGADFSEKGRLQPATFTLKEQINGASQATITLPGDADIPALRDWVELYTAKGSAGMYRVTSGQETVKGTYQLTLLHASDTFSDAVWPAQEDYSGTAKDFLQKILSYSGGTAAAAITATWSQGSLSEANGSQVSAATAIRTAAMQCGLVRIPDGMQVKLHGYKGTTWLGVWSVRISGFEKATGNGSAGTAFTGYIDEELAEAAAAGATSFRLVMSRVNGQAIKPADAGSAYFGSNLSSKASTLWQLGTVEDTGKWERKSINYTRLDTLMNELATQRDDYGFTYDFTTTPWTISFVKLPDVVEAEFRASRNMVSCKINRSDADLCTRLHLSISETVNGNSDKQKTLVTLKTYDNTAAQANWGIVEKTAGIDLADVPDPDAWAEEFMAKRAVPSIAVSVDGLELAAKTGESLDSYCLGRKVRVALPDEGLTVEERVVSINHPDPLGQEERVTVELANTLPRFSENMASLAKNAAATASHASASAASNKKDIEHWSIVTKKQQETLEGTGIYHIWESGITVDAEEGTTIYSLSQGIESAYAALKVSTEAISAEVARATEAEGTLSSRITQTATDITSEVSRATSAEGTLRSQIQQAADKISLLVTSTDSGGNVVNSAAIILAINGTGGSSATISADKVDLGNYATVKALETERARITSLATGATTADLIISKILTATGQVNCQTLSVGGALWSSHQLTGIGGGSTLTTFLGTSDADLDHTHTINCEADTDGNVTVTLGKTKSGDSASDSFNIADTAFYQAGVAAATKAVKVKSLDYQPDKGPSASDTGSSSTKITFPLRATADNDNYLDKSIEYSAGWLYTKGGTDAKAAVTLSGAWNDYTAPMPDRRTWTVSNSANADTIEKTVRLGAGAWANNKKYVYILDGSTNMARLEVDATSIYNSVGLSSVAKDGNATYSTNKKTVYIPVTATLTNGQTGAGTVSCDVSESYNAGRDSVTQRTVSSVACGGDITNSSGTYTLPIKVTMSDNTTSTHNITVTTSETYVSGSTYKRTLASNSHSNANYTWAATSAYNAGANSASHSPKASMASRSNTVPSTTMGKLGSTISTNGYYRITVSCGGTSNTYYIDVSVI